LAFAHESASPFTDLSSLFPFSEDIGQGKREQSKAIQRILKVEKKKRQNLSYSFGLEGAA
jgi:hypothetical protein